MNTTNDANTLWQKLSTRLTPDSRPLVERAYEMAATAHEGQWRDGRDNAPYISHPLRVALILAEELGRTDGDLLAIALLHDTLEDTDLFIEDLRDAVGADIANGVELLTKEEVPQSQKQARDSAYYSNIINGGEQVRLVKCADRLDNLRGLQTLNDPPRWQKYVNETRTHILPIAEMTDARLHQKLMDIIQ
jgi:guanosine-3',5'-bis(diphosphate) 3'-pyrophosphohydrolase